MDSLLSGSFTIPQPDNSNYTYEIQLSVTGGTFLSETDLAGYRVLIGTSENTFDTLNISFADGYRNTSGTSYYWDGSRSQFRNGTKYYVMIASLINGDFYSSRFNPRSSGGTIGYRASPALGTIVNSSYTLQSTITEVSTDGINFIVKFDPSTDIGDMSKRTLEILEGSTVYLLYFSEASRTSVSGVVTYSWPHIAMRSGRNHDMSIYDQEVSISVSDGTRFIISVSNY